MTATPGELNKFKRTVWAYYKKRNRDFLPWRKTRDAYKVLVSELMLQQTQVVRVVPKYKDFLRQFPTIHALARSSLADVLRAWQGLGYNRRAKFLHLLAKAVMNDHQGKLPTTEVELIKLPGIGKATASALVAFAYNKPTLYLETNVRSCLLHHFFPNLKNVADSELLPILESVQDTECPREWNWALLDYGSYIKSTYGNPNARSKHYAKQSKFQGSNRQLRGQILRLLKDGPLGQEVLLKTVDASDARAKVVVDSLIAEGLISKRGTKLYLGSE